VTVASAQSSGDPVVLVRRSGRVLTISINRPRLRNAINLQVARELASALDLLDSDDDLQVGILTGEGGYFSSGMDLAAAAKGEFAIIEGRGSPGSSNNRPVNR
jgi:enoyl-CoA hydratase